ncbi:hypothetical protein GCM10020000_62740 [Streptomyces olivoverticillatus]
MVGEAVQLPLPGAGVREGLAERRCEGVEDGRGGLGGRTVEVAGVRDARHQRLGVLGGPRLARGGLGGPHQRLQILARHRRARDHARGGALAAVDRRDDGDGPAAGDTVGGERVGGPAQIGGRPLLGDDDAPVGARQLQGTLDDFMRLVLARTHRPASCVVFKLCFPGVRPRTPRPGACVPLIG